MFTGRRLDPETRSAGFCGLYYYRARIYNLKLARFMQTDPIGYRVYPELGRRNAMNLYQYCGNNPVNWIDPWGLRMAGPDGEFDDYGPPEQWNTHPWKSYPDFRMIQMQNAYNYIRNDHPDIFTKDSDPKLVVFGLPFDYMGLGIFNTVRIDVDDIWSDYGVNSELSQRWIISYMAHELMHLEDGFWETVFLGEEEHQEIRNRAEEVSSEWYYGKKGGE